MNVISFCPFPVLITKRLVLRQLTYNDANELFAIRSNEIVGKYVDRQPAKTVEDAGQFIERITKFIANNESVLWGITIGNNDKIIGTVCLWQFSENKDKAEIGYELLPEWKGRGIMNEAIVKVIDYGFNTLNLNSIGAETYPDNEASLKLLERNGFVYTGKFEKFSVFVLNKSK
jgi:ribosomal-protein-alanine N-acetyltransferase